MATYVALLRAVNVSGKNKLRTADLRDAVCEAGFENVRTYVQSGNLIVDAKAMTRRKVEPVIHGVIADSFGLDVPVVVRTAKQWRSVLDKRHFGELDVKHRYVMFFEKKPTVAAVNRLAEIPAGEDSYRIDGTELYLCLPTGAGRTRLTNKAIEAKTGVAGTTRNWRSVTKIGELLG